MKLNNGDVIIFPTDTVYGIGCRIDDDLAIKKIYEIKHRPEEKRLAVLCASVEDIKKIADLNDDAVKLINEFMPGPLTIILNSKPEVRNEFILDTVGVRIPNHDLALNILKINGPMATSSVNRSGEPPLNDYVEIVEHFDDYVTSIYPNSQVLSKVSSTVISLVDGKCTLIREGNIKFKEITIFLNK